jgi:hypothetical protein
MLILVQFYVHNVAIMPFIRFTIVFRIQIFILLSPLYNKLVNYGFRARPFRSSPISTHRCQVWQAFFSWLTSKAGRGMGRLAGNTVQS